MAANRFTKFSGQQYVSNYTPVPFEAIMQVGAQKQAIQDKAQEETATVDNAIQKLKALPQYKEFATKAVSDIHEGIVKYSTMDFNDPSTRQAWNKERINIASRYAPTGDLGKINMDYELGMKWQQDLIKNSGKKDEWDTKNITDFTNRKLYDFKNDEANFTGEGVYSKVDEATWLKNKADLVNADKTSMGMSRPYGTGVDFVSVVKTGTTKELKYGKIMRALIGGAEGDADLQQSLVQRGRFNGVADDVSTQFTVDSGKKDKEGKPIYEYNMANPFVRQADAIAQGAAYKEEDSTYHYITDQKGLDQQKYALEHPVVAIGMPVDNSTWFNSFGTIEAVAGQKTATKDAIKSAWKQMIKDSPELWNKVGYNPNVPIDGLIESLDKKTPGGFTNFAENFIKTYGKDLGNKTNNVTSSLTEYRMITQLDKEADEYAIKISGSSDEGRLNIIKSNSNPLIKKMSQEDLTLISNVARESYKNYGKDNAYATGIGNHTLEALEKKYGFKLYELNRALYSDGTYNKLQTSEDAFGEAKNKYLADRGKIVETSQTGWSTIDVVNPDGTVNKDASDKLTRSLQTYFGDRSNVLSVYSTQVDENGLPMTIQQIIDIKAEKKGLDADKISVGKTPLYGTGYDRKTGKVNRNMYITVDGEQIPIDMSSVNTEINGRVQPLSNVDANPIQKTNNWITNTFGHGIQEYQPDNIIPDDALGMTDINTGEVMIPQNSSTFKVIRPTMNNSTGKFSDNSTLKVQMLDINGVITKTLVGTPAFTFLQGIETQQGLK